MKFQVVFKTPDVVHDAINKAVQQCAPSGLSDAELDEFCANKQDELLTFLIKWVKYAECINIEFDTELDTATVIPREGA